MTANATAGLCVRDVDFSGGKVLLGAGPSSSPSFAFVWPASGGAVDLAFGDAPADPVAIKDAGNVVIACQFVPEPRVVRFTESSGAWSGQDLM